MIVYVQFSTKPFHSVVLKMGDMFEMFHMSCMYQNKTEKLFYFGEIDRK